MDIPQRAEDMVDGLEASRFVAMRAPVLWTAGALFNVLAWSRTVFQERDIKQRLDTLEPRLDILERNHLAIEPRLAALEARGHGDDRSYEEYNIEMDNRSRIIGLKRYCTAEELQKAVRFTPKSCTFTIGSSRSPLVPLRRSGRLQLQERAGDIV